MKKILIAILILFSGCKILLTVEPQATGPQAPIVFTTIEEMQTYAGSYTLAIVTDKDRGGTFYKKSTGTADNGIIFSASGAGYWVRDISQSDGAVNIMWYGAKRKTNISGLLSTLFFSQLYHTINIPDTFYMSAGIGFLSDIYLPNVNAVKDLHINGVGKAALIYNGPPTQAMFAFNTRGKIKITNLVIDGGNLAVRGLNIRSVSSIISSSIFVEDCVVKNFRLSSTNFALCIGLYFIGNISEVYINRDSIYNIISGGVPLVNAPFTSGVLFADGVGGAPKIVKITNSFIGNVYDEDRTYLTDQQGAYTKYPTVDSADNLVIIENNTFFNCKTRFIKLQTLNNHVNRNKFIIDNFQTNPTVGSTTNTISIDAQYGDIEAIGNEFLYKKYSHITMLSTSNRDTTGANRLVFTNNKITASGDSIVIAAIVASNQVGADSRTSNTTVSDNVVEADSIQYLLSVRLNGDYRENRVVINNNRVNRLSRSLVYSWYANVTTNIQLKVMASFNINKFGSVPMTTRDNYTKDSVMSFMNYGFTNAESMARNDMPQNNTANNTYTGNNTHTGITTITGQLKLTSLPYYTATNDSILVRNTSGVIGYRSNPTQIGSQFTFNNTVGGTFTPQIWNTQTSGTAATQVAVYDLASNTRLATFVDAVNNVHGLTTMFSSGTSAFVYTRAGAEKFRVGTNGNFGIGSTTTTSMFNVGSAAQFQVNSTGNIVKLNNVTTSFPAANGAGVLRNDGTGVLTWSTTTGLSNGIQAATTKRILKMQARLPVHNREFFLVYDLTVDKIAVFNRRILRYITITP